MADKKVEVTISAKDETKGPLAAIRGTIAEWASDIRTKFVEAFAFEKILEKSAEYVKDFVKESIDKAAEAETAWAQLGNTLGNFGLALDKTRPEIEAHVAALQKVANVRTDEAIAGFEKLLMVSGDYQGSLANLTLVADVAAKKHESFADAAELVGRVMAGTGARGLREFGISTKDAQQAIEELRQKVSGAALTDMGTFAGGVQHVKQGFQDLEEAVGDVIVKSDTASGDLSALGNQLQQMAEQVKTHRSEIERFGVGLLDFFEALGAGIGALIMELTREVTSLLNMIPHAVNSAIDGLNHLPGFHIAHMFTLDGAEALFRQRAREAYDGMKTAWAGVVAAADGSLPTGGEGGGGTPPKPPPKPPSPDPEAVKKWKEEQRAFAKAGFGGPGIAQPMGLEQTRGRGQFGTVDVNSTVAALGGISGNPLDLSAGDLGKNDWANALTQGIDTVTTKLEAAGDASRDFGDSITDLGKAPIQSFGDAASKAFEAWATKSGSAGKAFEGAIASSVKSVAMKKGQFYEAEALGALGEGLLTGNPDAFAAAAEDAAAAAAFFALGGAAGGAMGGGGGGGGGGGRNASRQPSATNPASGLQNGQGTVTVYLTGKKTVIDHQNPDDMYALEQMIQQLAGTRAVQFVFQDQMP